MDIWELEDGKYGVQEGGLEHTIVMKHDCDLFYINYYDGSIHRPIPPLHPLKLAKDIIQCDTYEEAEKKQAELIALNEYTLTIKGFKTEAQVKAFLDWYDGQGEQDASIWFREMQAEGEIDVNFMPVDCVKMNKQGDVFVRNNLDLFLDIKRS